MFIVHSECLVRNKALDVYDRFQEALFDASYVYRNEADRATSVSAYVKLVERRPDSLSVWVSLEAETPPQVASQEPWHDAHAWWQNAQPPVAWIEERLHDGVIQK